MPHLPLCTRSVWDGADATVVCRQLGFEVGTAWVTVSTSR